MFNVVLELAVSFIQYFSTLVAIPDISFPDEWKKPMEYVESLNVGLKIFAQWFPSLEDIRVYFMVLSVIGPLAFIFAGLFFLNEKRVVVWYLFVVVGVMLVLAGTVGRIVAETTQFNITAEDSQTILYIGLVDLAIMGIILLIYRRFSNDQDEGTVVTREKLVEEETKSVNCFSTLQAFVLAVGFAVFGALCAGFIVEDVKREMDNVGDGFGYGIAGVCLIFFIIFFIWFIMGLSVAGRKLQWSMQTWVEARFLKVLLLTMSLAYIPISSGVFLMFNCNDFSCPDGYRLPDDGSFIESNATTLSTNDYCVPCTVASAQTCPTTFASTLCKSDTSSRLEYSISTGCNGVRAFFWPAGFLVLAMFVLGVPFLFYYLIDRASAILADKFPIKEVKNKNDDPDFDMEAAKWHKQVTQSQTVAKFLFQPFQFRYRQVRLFQLIQKLLIVGTTAYVIRNSVEKPQVIALCCAIAIHALSSILLLFYRPFLSKFEARIAVLMAIALTVSSVISLLLLKGYTLPTEAMIAMIAINGALPVIAIVIGVYLEWSSGKEDEEEAEKEAMMRLTKEMEKKQEEEEAREREQLMAMSGAAPPCIQVETTAGGENAQCGVVVGSNNNNNGGSFNAGLDATQGGEMSVMSHTGGLNTVNDPMAWSVSMKQNGSFLPPVKETAKEKKRRQLRALRMRQDARLKVRNELEKEQLALNDAQADVDHHIDRFVKGKLQVFLMVGGVIGFVALAMCLLGIMARQDVAVGPVFPSESTTATQLAGYDTWADFTSNCCCTANTNKKSDYVTIEKWLCVNGNLKERVRETKTASGLVIRGTCSVNFASDCTLNVNNQKTVSLSCTNIHTENELKLW